MLPSVFLVNNKDKSETKYNNNNSSLKQTFKRRTKIIACCSNTKATSKVFAVVIITVIIILLISLSCSIQNSTSHSFADAALLFGNEIQSIKNAQTTSDNQVEKLAAKSEALIISTDDNNEDDQLATSTSEHEEVKLREEGSCSLSTVSRRPFVASGSQSSHQQAPKQDIIIIEKLLRCSQVEDLDPSLMANSSFWATNKFWDIQQIEITESEPLVVPVAISFICEQFNCSKLTVFNLTGIKSLEIEPLTTKILSWRQLEVLDLSNNSLTSFESFLQYFGRSSNALPNLTSLLLDHNNITDLNFDYIIKRLPNLRHLSLVRNQIFNINCSLGCQTRVRNQFDTVKLAHNSINCEKSQLWLMRQIQSPLGNLKFPESDYIKCSIPESLNDMTWNQRISVLTTPTCDYCECKSLKKALAVDCSNKNLTGLPDVLPLNTKILNLTSNRIVSLEKPRNSISWENVTYVYLQNNLISSFQPLEIDLKFMRNLTALDIRRNKFQEFPTRIFEQFTNLDQVQLSNNPWLCDCEPTIAFQEWLQRQFLRVGDKEEIICGISGTEENGVRSNDIQQRLSSRVIYRLSKSELCPEDNHGRAFDWLDLVNFLLGITIVLIITKVTLDYIYQHRTNRLPHFFKLNF